jgi:serine phosphatase RsbU (regulator of sigma subunit)
MPRIFSLLAVLLGAFGVFFLIYLMSVGILRRFENAFIILNFLFAVVFLFTGIASFFFYSPKRSRATLVVLIISLVLVSIGVSLKYLQLPGAGICIIVGAFALSFTYTPLRFLDKYQKWKSYSLSSKDALYLSLFDLIGSVSLFLGVLFRIMHWPGSIMLVSLGAPLLLLSMIGWNRKFQSEVMTRKKMQDDLAAVHHALSESHKEVKDSINYAKRIQSVYLPPQQKFDEFFSDGFIFFQPKDVVSGDFYWFFNTGAQEGKASDEYLLAVADCTGHGVPGAIMSVICCNALNDVVVTRKIYDPATILDEARKIIVRTMKSDSGSGQKDGMDIAMIKWNKSTGQIQFAGANNPGWIYRHASNTIEVLPAQKQPVGYFERAEPFVNVHEVLHSKDMLFLFSDGFADQFGGPRGKKFKYSALQELLIQNAHLPSDAQAQLLQDVLENWKGELEQVDDITLVGFRRS